MSKVSEREVRLTRMGYRALAIGFNKKHLGDHLVVHFADRATRLFEAAIEEWKHAQTV